MGDCFPCVFNTLLRGNSIADANYQTRRVSPVIIHIVFHLDSFYFLLYLLDIHFLPDKIENLELHLDQEKEGNLWRFLNHSDDPNIKVFSYFDELNGIEVVKVYAIKSVKSGDELCFDYGEKYWNQSDD